MHFGKFTFLADILLALVVNIAHGIYYMIEKNLWQLSDNLYPLSLGWSKARDYNLNLETFLPLASYWSLGYLVLPV